MHTITGTRAACLADAQRAQRLRPMSCDTFRAWRDNGTALDVAAATTLAEAVELAKPDCSHKTHFVIEQTTANARRFLHHYAVTKSTTKGFYRESYDGGPRVFVGFCEAKFLFSMQVYSPLEPVAPWQWSDADRTGEKHGLCPDLVTSGAQVTVPGSDAARKWAGGYR